MLVWMQGWSWCGCRAGLGVGVGLVPECHISHELCGGVVQACASQC